MYKSANLKVITITCLISIIGCTNQKPDARISEATILQDHYEIILKTYKNCHLHAVKMSEAINRFENNLTEDHLNLLKKQWKDTKNCYSLAESSRFAGHYIDEIDTLINAWPIDEMYIDYVEHDPWAGLINKAEIDINSETLADLNEHQGETNISIGFHAIEFLLWGQDLNANGPGNRPLEDYTNNAMAERRIKYLSVTGQVLAQHLNSLVINWNTRPQNINQVITGLGTFIKAELVGERIQVALDTYDQEDEQSCFSDQTHNDIIYNIKGVRAILTGQLELSHDTQQTYFGLLDLIKQENPAVTTQILHDLDQSLQLMESLDMPFDQSILPINSKQRKLLEQVASLMSGVAKKLRILQYQADVV